jgi:hypothetical protein
VRRTRTPTDLVVAQYAAAMLIALALIVIGCALGAVGAWKQGDRWKQKHLRSPRMNPALLGAVFIAVLGGASAERHIGWWAYPLTLIPLYGSMSAARYVRRRGNGSHRTG